MILKLVAMAKVNQTDVHSLPPTCRTFHKKFYILKRFQVFLEFLEVFPNIDTE